MSKRSKCPVCNGHREVHVQAPTVPCAFCGATGKQPHSRLTCQACRGKGVVHLAEPTTECPQCDGTGKEPGEMNLPCWVCKGAGWLGKNTSVPKEVTAAAAERKAAAKERAAKRAAAGTTPAGVGTQIDCAFCSGTGVDPFGVMSQESNCPVCNGRGKVHVQEPTVSCAYCHATGNQPGTRLTCTTCHGKGVLHLAGPTTQCPNCDGSGREPKTNMPCGLCKGAGLISRHKTVPTKVLEKKAKRKAVKRKAARRTTPPEEMMVVKCAFCDGVGVDPFGVMSVLSKCPVCNGRTKVSVRKPAYPCAYCHGTGRQRGTKLSCGVCKGTGHVTVPGPVAECPECDGRGKRHGARLPCVLCRGTGLVTEKSTEKATVPAQDNSTDSQGGAAEET
ncbi:MAG: hypothetical protein KAY37_04460 [Phycisphaerae bacterium]|nr:hypothetical protein [Phycisphaerae bacterium]